jgi:hypothetical protein
MVVRSLPARWAASTSSAISARTRPLGLVAAYGRSSVIGRSTGPYMYRLSASTSLAPAAAAPSRTARVIGRNSCGQRL